MSSLQIKDVPLNNLFQNLKIELPNDSNDSNDFNDSNDSKNNDETNDKHDRLNNNESYFSFDTKNVDFLDQLKLTLKELYLLPINDVRKIVQSIEFKTDHDIICSSFWKEFKSISKHDCSLDSALLLQHFGFDLRRD